MGEPPQLQRTARRAPSFVQPRAVTSQTPPPPPRLPEGPIIHDALTLPASSIASNDSSVASNNPADALQQQQLVNATQHPYDARLISTPQNQSLSLGNGHSGFGAPRRLILSEERSSRYERHGYVHAGPTPAQFYFPPGVDANTMLPQAGAIAAPQLFQPQPLIQQQSYYHREPQG